jgi:hypothetical protein
LKNVLLKKGVETVKDEVNSEIQSQ